MSLYEAVKGNLLSGIAGYGLLSQSTHNMESYVLFVWLRHNIIIKERQQYLYVNYNYYTAQHRVLYDEL